MDGETERDRFSRVLIVEDDESQRFTLSSIIEREGYDVVSCSTAGEAVEYARSSNFGVAVVDLRLPDLEGTQLLQQIRELNGSARVIIHTGYGSFDSARDSVNRGAFAYVEKGGDPTVLVQHVHRAFRDQIDRYTEDLEDAVARRTESLRQEIAERQRAEEALRESQDRLREVVDSLPLFLTSVEAGTNRVLLLQGPVEQLVGYTADEFYADPDLGSRLVYPDDAARVHDSYREGLASRKPFTIEYRLVHRRDEHPVWVQQRIVPVCDEDGTLVRQDCIVIDISERKRSEEEREQLESQLQQMQKMEAVGQLAGGVAHDFNNLLTAILGNMEIALPAAKAGLTETTSIPVVRAMEQIQEAGQRAAALTRQLLAFSRRQVCHVKEIDPNRVIRGLENMLRRLVGEPIEFRVELAPDIASIRADVAQIEQVILHLVVNAQEAMPEGGVVTVRTENVVLDERYVAAHLEARPGPHVHLSVADTGVGMDEDLMARIFEPFFTTKPVGKGTGLGLASVYGTTAQAGGHIMVDSEPGKGSTFHVYLPAEETCQEKPTEAPRGKSTGGPETVLICEDEPMVCRLTKDALEMAGYTVLEAVNGKHATEVAAAHDGPIHLLVTDVIMPEMNGQELATQLRDRYGQMGVLFMSGYAADVIDPNGETAQDIEFMDKPFSVTTLLQRVRDVLDKAKA